MAGEQTDWNANLQDLVRHDRVRQAVVEGAEVAVGADALAILTGTCARLVNTLLTGVPLDVSEEQLAAVHGATLRALHALERAGASAGRDDLRAA